MGAMATIVETPVLPLFLGDVIAVVATTPSVQGTLSSQSLYQRHEAFFLIRLSVHGSPRLFIPCSRS